MRQRNMRQMYSVNVNKGGMIVKDIMKAPFVEEMKKMTANMYRLGWDERNGGNISWMLDEAEVAEYLDINAVIRTIPIGFEAKALVGKIFIVTGTGKYFKNVMDDPETNLGIFKIADDGCTTGLILYPSIIIGEVSISSWDSETCCATLTLYTFGREQEG